MSNESVRQVRIEDDAPGRYKVLVDGNDPCFWEGFGCLDGPAEDKFCIISKLNTIPCARAYSKSKESMARGDFDASALPRTLSQE